MSEPESSGIIAMIKTQLDKVEARLCRASDKVISMILPSFDDSIDATASQKVYQRVFSSDDNSTQSLKFVGIHVLTAAPAIAGYYFMMTYAKRLGTLSQLSTLLGLYVCGVAAPVTGHILSLNHVISPVAEFNLRACPICYQMRQFGIFVGAGFIIPLVTIPVLPYSKLGKEAIRDRVLAMSKLMKKRPFPIITILAVYYAASIVIVNGTRQIATQVLTVEEMLDTEQID